MAANAGVTPSTMRRQVRRLAVLGLIRIEEKLPTLRFDPDTGRIVSRIAGLRPAPVVIVCTLNEGHMRPSKPKTIKQPEDHNRPTPVLPEDHNRPTPEDHNRPTSEMPENLITEQNSKMNFEQPPSGDADGVSTPSAAAEEPTFGWATVAPAAARPPVDHPPTKPRYVEPDRPCRPWTDDSAERFKLTRQRLTDDQNRRDAEDLLAKGGLLAQTSTIDGRRIDVGRNAVRDCA